MIFATLHQSILKTLSLSLLTLLILGCKKEYITVIQAPAEDNTPPSIVWLAPTPGDTIARDIQLSFYITDESQIDTAELYLNGRLWQIFSMIDTNFYKADVVWQTEEHPDGIYTISIRASDAFGNIGFMIDVIFTIWNDQPRVLWVPDDFETIQGAINASRDGDTVRVRAGTYREGLYLMKKKIWLESEEGPEVTIIDASVQAFGIRIDAGQDSNTVIRGLTFSNANFDGISITNNSSPNVFNCIIKHSVRYNFVMWDPSLCRIMNNIFDSSGSANVNFQTAFGLFVNNIVINSGRTALWNLSLYYNPLIIDYNLICYYERLTNDPPLNLGKNNILDREPLFIDVSYTLRGDSPCLNSGDPNILDINGSRSDIGVYGGPFGYLSQ